MQFYHVCLKQFNIDIKIIRSDNGKKFDFIELFYKLGVLQIKSCVETPQQNSIAEKIHQHILNITRSLIFQYGLPKSYWSYVVAHVVYLINKLTLIVVKKKIFL